MAAMACGECGSWIGEDEANIDSSRGSNNMSMYVCDDCLRDRVSVEEIEIPKFDQ